MRSVADAGPLIALFRIDALDLVRGLFAQILVTEEGRNEALPMADYPGKSLIAEAFDAGWLVCPEPFETSWQPINSGLDAGERSTIAAARPVLERLQPAGYFIHPRIIEAVLKEIGE